MIKKINNPKVIGLTRRCPVITLWEPENGDFDKVILDFEIFQITIEKNKEIPEGKRLVFYVDTPYFKDYFMFYKNKEKCIGYFSCKQGTLKNGKYLNKTPEWGKLQELFKSNESSTT